MPANVERPRLIEHVLELEERVFQAMHPIAPKEWLSVDLTMPQLKILLLLFTDGPARMGFLTSSLGVSMATTTGIADRMVERGLIVRESDPEDRRVVVCKLSEKGREMASHLWQLRQAQARGLLERMTTPQIKLISKAMEVILQAARVVEQDCHSAPRIRQGEADAFDSATL